MIPIYEAIEFVRIMDGGSTSPWLVLVDVNGTSIPYVMKLYRRRHQMHDIVMKEILAATLSTQFEIGETEIAMIKLTRRFVRTLAEPQLRQLTESGYKTKFATKLIEPAIIYSNSKVTNALDKIDKANIYAFDNLILHRDRRLEKPNLLIDAKSYYLIDNESCLSFPLHAKTSLENNNFDYLYREHLFLTELKKIKDKNSIFDTFGYYLQEGIALKNIDFIPNYLGELHHPYSSFSDVYDYLKSIKRLSSRFINHLSISLQ